MQAGPMACGSLWWGPVSAATWPHPVTAGRQGPGLLNSDSLCCTRTGVIPEILFSSRVPVCPCGCHSPQQELCAELSVIRLWCHRCAYSPLDRLLPEARATSQSSLWPFPKAPSMLLCTVMHSNINWADGGCIYIYDF